MVRINMDCFVKKLQPDMYEKWKAGLDLAPHPHDKSGEQRGRARSLSPAPPSTEKKVLLDSESDAELEDGLENQLEDELEDEMEEPEPKQEDNDDADDADYVESDESEEFVQEVPLRPAIKPLIRPSQSNLSKKALIQERYEKFKRTHKDFDFMRDDSDSLSYSGHLFSGGRVEKVSPCLKCVNCLREDCGGCQNCR